MIFAFGLALLISLNLPVFADVHFLDMIVVSLIVSAVYFGGLFLLKVRLVSDLMKLARNHFAN